MATKILATSQMSIVDLSDLPTLGLYLTSSQPTTVVYDPDEAAYVPDWSTNNLVLTPVVHLDSQITSLTSTELSIEWKRKYGTEAETTITSGTNGETISNGVLTVSNNKFINYSIVTYICVVTYTDPDTGSSVSTQSSISYGLIRNAPTVKSCSIVGDNTFLYDGERNLITASKITLTAILNNVTVRAWQYYNSSTGVWTNYTFASSYTSDTLVVKATDSCFYNDKAQIKLLTSDDSVYDIIAILKLKDGAAGGDSVVVSLSNDSHTLPADGDGNVISYNGASTIVSITTGGDDTSFDWAIVANPGSGVTGTSETDDEGHLTYTVTELTDDASYVEFVCTYPKTGTTEKTITKRFSLIKNRSGVDAVVYELEVPTKVINRDKDDNYSPTSVTFNGYSRVGDNDRNLYSGIYKFYLSTDGETFNLVKTAGTTNSPVTGYTYPSSTDVQFHTSSGTYYKALRCEMYDSTGTTLLDTETVVIVSDGSDGATGTNGKGGYSIVLGNYSDNIPCDNDGSVSSAKIINIPFKAYVGIEMVACNCSVVGLPTGITSTVTNSTNTTEGKVQLTVTKGSDLGGNDSGEITLTFTSTIDGSTVSSTEVFSWSKSIQGADGENAINFYIHPVNGTYVFENGEGDVTLQAFLLDGATDVSSASGVTYNWYIMESGAWSTSKGTGVTYAVDPDDVISCACFRCIASYSGKEYTAYITVLDNTDPYTCTIECTLGTQLVNSSGYGAVYCRLFRGSEEIDSLVTNNFVTTLPSTASSGDYCYYIDSTKKTVTLKQYSSSAWKDATDPYGYTYNWYARNKDGSFIDSAGSVVTKSTLYASGKAFYVDGSKVDEKITYNVEVVG